MAVLFHLGVIIREPNRAKPKRDEQDQQDIPVVHPPPQDRRDHQRSKDHDAAHRGRALFLQQMTFRPILADRLALALHRPQAVDDRLAEDEPEHQRSEKGATGAKGNITKQVKHIAAIGQRHKQFIKHLICPFCHVDPLSRADIANGLHHHRHA